MSNDTGRRVLRFGTAFVVGVVTLTLELAYTRVISFKLFYYYTYFVIGLALLGLGAASAVTALSTRVRATTTESLVRVVAPPAALAGVVGYAIVARLPIDTFAIWTGTTGEMLVQIGALLALSLAITGVFFGAGMLLAALFVVEADRVRRLYFWDLLGAALGCLLAIPLQSLIGPPAMILTALVLLAVLGAVAAQMDSGGPSPSTRSVGRTAAYVLAAVAAVGAVGAGRLDVRTDDIKTYGDGGDNIEFSRWGSVFRVDVAAVPNPDLRVLLHDGQWGSGIWAYDGTPATTERFATDSRQVPFAATAASAPRVLIIGAAGGHEIQAALHFGAGHVDAVELNPTTVDLLRGRYAEFSGNIVDDPRVNYVQGDGRTFLARSNDSYDVIWFVAPDSYAANSAAAAGAFVLSESYLYTAEMIEKAFDHLTPEGVMVTQFGENEFDTRPIRTPRYLVTMRAAVADGMTDFGAHTGLIVERSDEFSLVRVSTIMLFRSAPDAATAARVAAAVEQVPTARTVHFPGLPSEPSLSTDLIVGSDAEVAAIVDGYRFDISAVTDDRPFFWHFTPFTDVLSQFQRNYEDSEIAIGERLIVSLLVIAAVVAAITLFVPFAVSRRRGGERLALRGKWRYFVYFACLGLGFMFIEISMIQRFSLLLGFPTLSLSVSLFTLLIATAVGARASGVVKRLGAGGPAAAVAALAVVTAIYLALSGPLTETALAWPSAARILIVFLLLFPVGLLLGVFLPTGVDAVSEESAATGTDRGRNVAWCWAVNGFFSVLGSTATMITSMTIGFNRTVVVGLALYVIAAAVTYGLGARGGLGAGDGRRDLVP